MTRIEAIRLYPLDLAFVGGGFATSYGHRTHLGNCLLEVVTADGATGWGEIARKAGNSPVPSKPERIALFRSRLAPVLGADASNRAEVFDRLGPVAFDLSNLTMALDTALYDVVARAANLPMSSLLGGACAAAIPTYRSISQASPTAMADEAAAARTDGCRVFQMKVGGETPPADDIARIERLAGDLVAGDVLLCDANGGWSPETARSVMPRFSDPRILWEEPTDSFDENRALAADLGVPVVLDQCVTGLDVVARACTAGVFAGIGIKPTFQSGLAPARTARDLCIAHGLKMKIDDSWVADVGTHATLHLAMATPPDLLIAGIDMRVYFETRVAEGGGHLERHQFSPPSAPGLGIVPDRARLGAAVEVG
ncbi:MAG: hypothetical protein GC150_01245 [Rhizobiales bacterium]|nr:hypothetical protein [Hyphomicrobiales bacterium]